MRGREPLAVWLLFGLFAVAIVVTYSRLPADELYHVFARRMSQLYPTARQVSLSRRGLSEPDFRVTRFNLWKDRVNPYKEQHRLPLLSGGLLAQTELDGARKVLQAAALTYIAALAASIGQLIYFFLASRR